jgi:hypothetical protein
MKRLLIRFAAGLLLLLGVVYAGDYMSLRYEIPRRSQLGTVNVREMYAIHEKNNKTEYQFPPAQDQTCVNSLFPHFGYPACWYLERHSQKRIEI